MKKKSLGQSLLGGPGHSGYAYKADVYCVECGQTIIMELYQADYAKLESGDTDDSPQPIFFGESPDCEQHCAKCHEYMYGESSEQDDEEES